MKIGLFRNGTNKLPKIKTCAQFKRGGFKNPSNVCLKLIRLLLVILMLNSFEYFLQTNNNKLAHILNGNRKGSSLKILHWNKGSSLFSNKVEHIKMVLNKYNPHIVSLSEANYDIERNIYY